MSQSDQPQPGPDDRQPARPQHLSARVPDSVGEGIFSTGVIVMTGASEFVIDFVQNLGGPAKLAVRVVVPHNIMPQFIQALQQNMEIYRKNFGAPPELPRVDTSSSRRPSIQEIYDELKMPDEKLSGAYANGLMVGHTAAEFKLDFLTNLPPHSAVSARVYLAAPQVPRMIESLNKTFEQFQQRIKQQRDRAGGDRNPSQEGPPPTPPPTDG